MMATRLRINANCSTVAKASTKHPPINFFYSHFHNSIRNELDTLSQCMSDLSTAPQENIHERLTVLKNRYRFLEQVYKYHSSVEDEVAFSPAYCLPYSRVHSRLRAWSSQFAVRYTMVASQERLCFCLCR